MKEEAPLSHPAGELEAWLEQYTGSGEIIRIGLPIGQDLVNVMNSDSDDPSQQLLRVYWALSPSSLAGVLGRIRSTLVSLVAEMQDHTPPATAPSATVADNAVNLVIYGGNPQVNVASGGSVIGDQNLVADRSVVGDQNVSTISSTVADQTNLDTELTADRPSNPWKNVWIAAVGIATIGGTVIGLVELLA